MTDSIVFAGLPHTGKSTYLGLVNLAMTQATRVRLQLGSFADDREHLNTLSKNLFTCEEPDRTLVDQRRGLALSVSVDGHETRLEIPDLSGEIWRDAVKERVLPSDLDHAVRSATGVCVFVHSGEFAVDPVLDQMSRDLSELGIEDEGGEENEGFASDEPGGQTALVDLLQLLGEQLNDVPDRRMSLVLSAFDTAGTASVEEWLRECAPLAAQYLAHNASRMNIRVFALSAQGGSFSENPNLDALRQQDPLARAFLVRDDGTAANLDEPICWALGID